MSRTAPTAAQLASNWRAVALVACTYIYFLIFAQFAFLKRLAELGIADDHLRFVMAVMATGGILASLVSASTLSGPSPSVRMRIAFAACGMAALFTLLPLGLGGSIAASLLIGAALGSLTVTLATHLRLWTGSGDGLLTVGLGTGLAYLICNLQLLFTATLHVQTISAAALCLAGVFISTGGTPQHHARAPLRTPHSASFALILVCFTALVWLDSAAFFIIQNNSALKAGTWEGAAHLRTDGLLHFAAALASVWLLRRRSLSLVLGLSVVALALACLLMLNPRLVLLGSLLYPVGVSLYSVALVAYPSLLAPATSTLERARKAGLIYAVAGWFGSAMGIGMGQHLGHVPIAFAALALVLVLGPPMWRVVYTRKRETAAVALSLSAAFCVEHAIGTPIMTQASTSPVERGKHVYLSEGCINCHSQYVRPNTPDVLMWGPTKPLDELHSERPPLIGNRRQGPDLSQVGGRRSPVWLRAHFYDPRQVTHASFMPSYRYLFDGSTRGDDLIAYLNSLKSPGYAEHLRLEREWQPSDAAMSAATPDGGAQLFNSHCATCHEPNGAVRVHWQNSFTRVPPNLRTGPWLRLPTSDTPEQRKLSLARIIKFGIPGTDMPGHEYLPDRDVAAIALWLDRSMIQPTQVAVTHIPGENR